MNTLFLKLALLFSPIWRSMGADIPQLKAILTAKLKMDDRKPIAFGRSQQKKNTKYASAFNMFFSALIGAMFMFVLVGVNDIIIATTLYFTTFLFMLTFTLITDFSTMIVDTKDKLIILPRPVDDRTLALSRMLHVFIYMLRIVLPMSLPGWIAIGLAHGWKYALLFPVPLFCLVFLSLFLVNGSYLLLLRLLKPERFKNVIGSFQMVLTFLVAIMIYIVPRAVKPELLNQLQWTAMGWIRFTPPYWLGATFSWVGAKETFPYTTLIAGLAIIVPLACLWISTRILAPNFARSLAAIDYSDSVPEPATTQKASGQKTFYRKLGDLFNRSDAAKAGFMITWLQTARSRSFKMRVWPSLIFLPMYLFSLTMGNDRSFTEVWAHLPETKTYIFLLYCCFGIMLQAISYVAISDQYKAAWIYYKSPLAAPGEVITGSFKALWVKFFLPFYGVIAILTVAVWGVKVLPDIILAVVNITLFAACIVRMSFRYFPFSQMEQIKSNGGKTTIRMLVTLVMIFVLGGAHYFATLFWWLKILFIVLSSGFFWLVWDSLRNTNWAAIRMAED